MMLSTSHHPDTSENQGLSAGFADPVHHAQACFRSILQALSTPGRVVDLAINLDAPAPLSPASAAILLTLADSTTRISIQSATAATRQWVGFHTGAVESQPENADFVFTTLRPMLATLNAGSDDMPEEGASLILDLSAFGQGRHYRLTGPGIETQAFFQAPLDANFASEWRISSQSAPRGIDILLCAGRQIIGLPRSVTIEEI